LENFADQVRWFDSLASLDADGVCGVIFSNELIDAMPVRRLGWDAAAQSWFEWGVGLSDCGLSTLRRASEDGRIPPASDFGATSADCGLADGPVATEEVAVTERPFVWKRIVSADTSLTEQFEEAGFSFPAALL